MKFNNLLVPDVVSGGEQITVYKCHRELFVVLPGAVCWCFLGSELGLEELRRISCSHFFPRARAVPV